MTDHKGRPTGRGWELRTTPTSVAAVTAAGTVAEAHVSTREGGSLIEFWSAERGLPPELSARLVAQAFSLPSVGTHCPVLVCVPRSGGELLAQARRHVQDARAHAAGVTCLLEGRIGEHPLPATNAATNAASGRPRPRSAGDGS